MQQGPSWGDLQFLSQSRNSPNFLKSEGLQPFSHKPNINLDPELAKSLCGILSYPCKHHFNIIIIIIILIWL